jgi:hypothetical protein
MNNQGFVVPKTEKVIMEKIHDFENCFTRFKSGMRALDIEYSVAEFEWSVEAYANYLFTDSIINMDTIIVDSTFLTVPTFVNSDGINTVSSDNANLFAEQLNGFIQNLISSGPEDFKYQFCDVSIKGFNENPLNLSIKVVRCKQLPQMRLDVSDFTAGVVAPIYGTSYYDANNASKRIQVRLNGRINPQFLIGGPPLLFYTSVIVDPIPKFIINYPYQSASCTPGTLIYMGTNGLLQYRTSNSNVVSTDLNISLNGLQNDIIYYNSTGPRKVAMVEMWTNDNGYIADTGPQQAVYPCYPDDYRYASVIRATTGIPISGVR